MSQVGQFQTVSVVAQIAVKRTLDVLGFADGAGQFGVPQNLDELLATVATEDIGRPQPGLHRMRNRAQHRIALEVAQKNWGLTSPYERLII